MTRNVRTYDYACLTARTPEQVGDRWSLLVTAARAPAASKAALISPAFPLPSCCASDSQGLRQARTTWFGTPGTT